MEKDFRSLTLFGVVGSLGILWYRVYDPHPELWVQALGVGIWVVTAICLVISITFKVIRKAPELSQNVDTAKVTKSVLEATDNVAEIGVGAFRSAIQKLTPLFLGLFAFEGKASRLKYLISQVGSVFSILFFTLGFGLDPNLFWKVILMIAILASLVCLLSFGVRRTRDIGVSHWWYLLILVPPVNLAVQVALLIVPSDELVGKGL
ncbi:hypothetical protein ASD8599_03090 [Ascidiaceihabitans donghaensis]|uniref:DUF805 domain-containing protein n=1 Tax=Ascidiaceihabitans donghaensis TaxID=1510460 RepID=A0A2R8BH60_9RHOB|nr:DUF805 domain-containing protein [Ascidiaceihabitans donghaensis]SPH22346.1 hypothetical protein ASD8599_03090 [Ascidiaceihabitans donghaensis]